MDIYLISGYIVGILLLSVTLLALIIYLGKLQVSRDKKDDELTDLREQVDEMTVNGNILQERATQLAKYYEYADETFRDMFSEYTVYKQTGIDNILKHRYFGDDPTIQHFIKETLTYDKTLILKMEEYNKNVQEIFTEEPDESEEEPEEKG